jgi:hypothetical protein
VAFGSAVFREQVTTAGDLDQAALAKYRFEVHRQMGKRGRPVAGAGRRSADCELLRSAGVATVGDLAQQDAASLHEKMVAVNESHKLVHAVPGVAQVEKAIEAAKELPQVVTV